MEESMRELKMVADESLKRIEAVEKKVEIAATDELLPFASGEGEHEKVTSYG
jgi:hypothetical protein